MYNYKNEVKIRFTMPEIKIFLAVKVNLNIISELTQGEHCMSDRPA